MQSPMEGPYQNIYLNLIKTSDLTSSLQESQRLEEQVKLHYRGTVRQIQKMVM